MRTPHERHLTCVRAAPKHVCRSLPWPSWVHFGGLGVVPRKAQRWHVPNITPSPNSAWMRSSARWMTSIFRYVSIRSSFIIHTYPYSRAVSYIAMMFSIGASIWM